MAMRRREFLRMGAAAVGVAAVVRPGWAATPISVSVKDHGAVGDGTAKDTQAIQAAIDEVAAKGGGEVLVQTGVFLTGGIALRSKVTLRLEKGAVLRGSPDLADYRQDKVRWGGKSNPGYLGLISAQDAKDIAIVGEGLIQGAPMTGGEAPLVGSPCVAWRFLPLRPPVLIEPIQCTNVRLEGFSTEYSGMGSIHPLFCEDVTISGLTMRSTGANSGGIEVDSSKHVKIDRCDISTGDNCISVGSGSGQVEHQMRRPSEDIEITNCKLADVNGSCIGIGDEVASGVRNVKIEHCNFIAAKLFAVAITTKSGERELIRNVSVDDADVSGLTGGFLRIDLATMGHPGAPVPGTPWPTLANNFSFKNVRLDKVPVFVDGGNNGHGGGVVGFTMNKVTGTAYRGGALSNVRDASFKHVSVLVPRGQEMAMVNVNGSTSSHAYASGADMPIATPYNVINAPGVPPND